MIPRSMSKMRDGGVSLVVAAYGVVISGLCKNGQLNKAMRVITDLAMCGFSSDKMLLMTIMDACFKAGNLKAASGFYRELLAKGFEPDAVVLQL
ncbi:putative pentatricopeptide [Rosa chinensis]|uniref:Putative pentatricopeptide n=1 Tax=Rosa chinensis TaxID=74649 RepID=A0A2P6R3P2_ROSCH|nr:putative pentatricopeptide [Rosa chinensis]